MKVIHNMKNRMIQEFQYDMKSQLPMISKDCESICDGEQQGESHFQEQRYHSLIQLKLMIKLDR
jgi:hypothetical protein